jgi:hypothetical protein
MSIRPSDAIDAGQNFSLRDVVLPVVGTTGTTGIGGTAGVKPRNAPLHDLAHKRVQPGLKFSLAELNTPRQTTTRTRISSSTFAGAKTVATARFVNVAAKPKPPEVASAGTKTAAGAAAAVVAAASAAASAVGGVASALGPVASAASVGSGAGSGSGSASSVSVGSTASRDKEQRNVAHMAAYLEEANHKLKQSNAKLEKTELQLARVSQTLSAERQTVHAKLQAYKHDLAAAHEVESKLRNDLAARPAKATLCDTKFQSSVGAILEQEDKLEKQQKESAAIALKIEKLTERHTELEASIARLTVAKQKMQKEVDGLRRLHAHFQQLACASRDEHAVAEENLNAMKMELEHAMETRMSVDELQERAEAVFDGTVDCPEFKPERKPSPAPVEANVAANPEHKPSPAPVEANVAASPERKPSPAPVEANVAAKAEPEPKPVEAKASPESVEANVAPAPAPTLPPRTHGRITTDAGVEGRWSAASALGASTHLAVQPITTGAFPHTVTVDAPEMVQTLAHAMLPPMATLAIGGALVIAPDDEKPADPAAAMIAAVVSDLKTKLTEMTAMERGVAVAPLA